MRTLTESRFWRFFTFAALYFAQGVPWGFVGVAYVVFLADQGLDKAAIGTVISWAYLPWSFKLFAGPIIDRFPSKRFGRRRHFIVTAELLMGLTLFALPFFDPRRQLGLINAALFVHNSFAAVQDVATDGLAVDVLPEDERGKANAVMWAAKGAGSAVGGSLGLLLAKHMGWMTLFVGIAILVWAIMILVVMVRERPAGAASEHAAEARFDLRVLLRSLAFSTPLLGIAIALLTPAGYALLGTLFTVMMRKDLKLSSETISMLSLLDLPLSVGGALFGGFVADRIGPRKTMAAGMLGMAASFAVFSGTRQLWASIPFLVGFTVVSSLCQYAYNAASLGFFMTISNPAVGATQFAIYMAATNYTYSKTSEWGGRLAESVGLPRTFLIGAVIQLVTIALLPLCNPRLAEERFRKKDADAGETRAAAAG